MYQQRKCEYCYLLNQLSCEVRKHVYVTIARKQKATKQAALGVYQLPRDKG